VKALLPNVVSEVVDVGIVQKMTDAGRDTSFRAIVAVGNGDGWFGVAEGKGKLRAAAVDRATSLALLRIIPVNRGCGSPECTDKSNHSLRFKTVGKTGSVKVELLPAPRGVGLVAGPSVKKLLELAESRTPIRGPSARPALRRRWRAQSTMPCSNRKRSTRDVASVSAKSLG